MLEFMVILALREQLPSELRGGYYTLYSKCILNEELIGCLRLPNYGGLENETRNTSTPDWVLLIF